MSKVIKKELRQNKDAVPRITNIQAKCIKYMDLSQGIQEELAEVVINNSLIWAKVPQSVKEVEDQPLWHDLCKQLDLPAGEKILINVHW